MTTPGPYHPDGDAPARDDMPQEDAQTAPQRTHDAREYGRALALHILAQRGIHRIGPGKWEHRPTEDDR